MVCDHIHEFWRELIYVISGLWSYTWIFKGANLCYQFEVFMFPNDDKVNDKKVERSWNFWNSISGNFSLGFVSLSDTVWIYVKVCTLETIYLFCDGKNILYTFAEFWSCEKWRSFCFYLVFQTFMESVLHQFCEYVAGIWSCCWNALFSWRNLEGKHQFPTAFLIRRNITRIFFMKQPC